MNIKKTNNFPKFSEPVFFVGLKIFMWCLIVSYFLFILIDFLV